MVGHTNLEEQVDKDFILARRKALLRRIGIHLRRDAASDGLLCFDDLRKIPGAIGRGTLTIGRRRLSSRHQLGSHRKRYR
jgi:hypothetical protein